VVGKWRYRRIATQARTRSSSIPDADWAPTGLDFRRIDSLGFCTDLEPNCGDPVLIAAQPVHGELTGSSGYWSLGQASTVAPLPVRTETSWCYTSSRRQFRQAPFQSRIRSMAVIVMLKIDQLRLQIGYGPE
jgi:hypothetical protein